MMLIELTLLRLGRAAFFQRLRCLTRKGSSYWSRCIRELGGRDARDDELGQEGEFKGAKYSEFRNPSVRGSPLEAEDAEKAGIKHPILQVAVCDGVESLGVCAASFEDISMTSPTWRALGQVVLIYLAVGSSAVTAQDTHPGRATFAEMIAFARLAFVPCQRLAPDADSFHALALRRLIQPPITEEEIAAKEKDIKRLRVRLGLGRWCKRYAGQMEQARILVQVLRRRN
jgi:hypothetical protein